MYELNGFAQFSELAAAGNYFLKDKSFKEPKLD